MSIMPQDPEDKTYHPSHPDLLMSRMLGVCWHSPTSDRWPCAPAEEVHTPFPDDGVTYCGWRGDYEIHQGCGELWPCSTVRARGSDA